jgi:hypothetical protein
MATTTNYGWTTPDDTALVKDGAAAIRTLGSSVDTTTKNLNPETTLGDIVYRSSTANVKTRLGIGSTGNILTVTGGVPVWAAPVAAGSMTLLASGSMAASTTGVDLQSISSDYETLILIGSGLSFTGSNGDVSVRLNNDSGANYAWNAFYSSAVVSVTGQNECVVSRTANSSNTTGQIIISFPNYTDTTAVQIVQASGYIGNPIVGMVGFWSTAGAVNRITLLAGDAFDAGTYKLFGVK